MTHEHTAFLCGHFTRNTNATPEMMTRMGWQPEDVDPKMLSDKRRLFYPEFVDFCYGDEHGCKAWKRSIGRPMTLTFRGQTYHYQLDELSIYLMPMNIVIFAIKVSQTSDDLNTMTAVMFSLRAIDYYSNDVHGEFIEHAITPFCQLHEVLTAQHDETLKPLVENGNKLRVYQIINTKGAEERPEGEDRDLLLYQLSTLSRVTKAGEVDDYSVAPHYLEKVMNESHVSVFRNWDALALMDTFTVHAYDASESLVGNWTGMYFRMIYLHSMFQKCYLFSLNVRFRNTLRRSTSALARLLAPLGRGNSEMTALTEEYETFDRWCCFHKISYNFLPLEINEALDKGLEIGEEKEQLATILEREKTRRDEANDKTVNTLLFCLSLLTLSSAIWDLSCLIDQMYPYADYLGSTNLGYRSVTMLVLLMLCITLYLIFHRKKR